MPFRVHYEIFDNKHTVPDFQTYDYTLARIEWADRIRNPKGLLWKIAPHIQRLRKFIMEIDIRPEVQKLIKH